MKKKILKVLALVACAVLLVFGSIAGTLAYMKDSVTVQNTFTAGNVAITMDEANVDLYGVPSGTRNAEGTGNEYKLIPGRTYTKDPVIRVEAGSEACYVFFKLENELLDNNGNSIANFDINGTNWQLVDGETNVYYYKDILVAGDTCTAFTKFEIANNADVAPFATGGSKEAAVVNVTAYAVQADGFDDANAAWTAAEFN